MKPNKRKLLLPIDGTPARLKAAVAEVVRICALEPVSVHLLSVQPSITSHVAMFFSKGDLHQIQHTLGAEDLAPAQAMLDAAGIAYTSSVVVGRSAETIAQVARELGCDRIVMGQESGGNFVGKIFGSLTEQVRNLVSSTNDCQVIGS